MPNPSKKVLSHFRERSARYNQSSRWVSDRVLLEKIFDMAAIRGGETVLDLATGTGLVAKQFHGKVREVIGLDISPDMTRQASAYVDRMLISPVESIPLPAESVDVCVCRQGLQFVDLPKAAAEIARVLRPGGRAIFCHLCAYGDADSADAFKIQALRNPSRVNFFKPGSLEAILERGGLRATEMVRYLSRESVDRWIDTGVGGEREKRAIKKAYRAASEDFNRLHEITASGEDIIDTMLFLILRVEKRPA
ncbi:MAG: class I SAM-dependent methyltransferase [Elusimicrobiota bacterium]